MKKMKKINGMVKSQKNANKKSIQTNLFVSSY